MILTRMRDSILRRSAARSTLLLLSIVIALLAGLLAMHVLASSMGSHDQHAPVTMAMADGPNHSILVTTPGPGESAVADCSGNCDPGHSMASMVCILALLAATIVLGAARSAHGFTAIPRPLHHHGGFAAENARDMGPPPDLTFLSISRT